MPLSCTLCKKDEISSSFHYLRKLKQSLRKRNQIIFIVPLTGRAFISYYMVITLMVDVIHIK